MTTDFDVLLDGLLFPESPRWHQGSLWFSEKRAGRVVRLDPDGRIEAQLDVDGEPGGIGWASDGGMLAVSMQHRTIVRVSPNGATTTHADLGPLTTYRCNDMVVDQRGNAYVGDFGYNMAAGEPAAAGVLVLAPASGRPAEIVADDLHFPNGAVVTPDGSTLIVAESAANRLTSFAIDEDGRLNDRHEWAALGAVVPDGICLDAEGAVWVADPLGNQVVRVREGGEILQVIATDQGSFACELGGHDGRTLFVCTYDAAASASPTPTPVGAIIATRVDVPRTSSIPEG
jgi:sugar lactone lactonase YvrE